MLYQSEEFSCNILGYMVSSLLMHYYVFLTMCMHVSTNTFFRFIILNVKYLETLNSHFKALKNSQNGVDFNNISLISWEILNLSLS